METLCNILQTDSITAVQSWLVNAPSRGKIFEKFYAISLAWSNEYKKYFHADSHSH